MCVYLKRHLFFAYVRQDVVQQLMAEVSANFGRLHVDLEEYQINAAQILYPSFFLEAPLQLVVAPLRCHVIFLIVCFRYNIRARF